LESEVLEDLGAAFLDGMGVCVAKAIQELQRVQFAFEAGLDVVVHFPNRLRQLLTNKYVFPEALKPLAKQKY